MIDSVIISLKWCRWNYFMLRKLLFVLFLRIKIAECFEVRFLVCGTLHSFFY